MRSPAGGVYEGDVCENCSRPIYYELSSGYFLHMAPLRWGVPWSEVGHPPEAYNNGLYCTPFRAARAHPLRYAFA